MTYICDYCGQEFEEGSLTDNHNSPNGCFCCYSHEVDFLKDKEWKLKKQQEKEQLRNAIHQQKQVQRQQAVNFEAEAKANGYLSAESALRAMEIYEVDNFEDLKQKQNESRERWAKEDKERDIKFTRYCNSLGAAKEPWKQLNRDINNLRKGSKYDWIPYVTGIVLPIVLRIAFKPLFEFLGWNVVFAIILFASVSFLINGIIEAYTKHKIIMKNGFLLHDKWPKNTIVYLNCFHLGFESESILVSFSIFLFFLLRHYLSIYLGFWKGFLISLLITAAIDVICYFTKFLGFQTKILKSEEALIGKSEYTYVPEEFYKETNN